ncbi:SDR family oxidoreductase [Rossellomorea marisflavi]|uniref:SDR family oxidoreductase n=1 Tax=Rossellomorea marisflavi TaxID=189381 RepID=UPI00203C69A1|nr:SDR family oxidoreductase [Rossellomorea marisflavi]MCM2605178.1 SDR family oxidoreductase [Rossellomorea marisflavi]
MNVLVIGANGHTGRLIVKELAQSEQHFVKAMIRKTEQAEEMENLGARPIVADLEGDFSYALDNVNAVIFAAGSGGSTGDDKTRAVDREGAIKAIDFAKEKGIERFVMLSSMGADNPSNGPEGLQYYLEAKGIADEHLKESRLNYTIVRPGALSFDPGTGKITASDSIADKSNDIPREDVAKVIVESITTEETYHKVFEILGGDVPVEQALKTI